MNRTRATLALLLPAALLAVVQAIPGLLPAPTVPWLVLALGTVAVRPPVAGHLLALGTAILGLLVGPSVGTDGLVPVAALLGASAVHPRGQTGPRGDRLAGAAAGLGLLALGHAIALVHPRLGPVVGWSVAALGPLAAQATALWRRVDPDRPAWWRLGGLTGPFREGGETALAAVHRTWPHASDASTRRHLVALLEHHLQAQHRRQGLAGALARHTPEGTAHPTSPSRTAPGTLALKEDLTQATHTAQRSREGLDRAHQLLTTGHEPSHGVEDRRVEQLLAPLRERARAHRARQATERELEALSAEGPTSHTHRP